METLMWVLIVVAISVVIGAVVWYAVSKKRRKFTEDLAAEGMALEDVGDDYEDDEIQVADLTAPTPAPETEPEGAVGAHVAVDDAVAAKNADVQVEPGQTPRLPADRTVLYAVLGAAFLGGLLGWNTVSTWRMKNRVSTIETVVASKADTTEVQELATRVTTQEGETKSLAESMTKLTELVETVYSKAVNASTAAEDARTKAEKAASAAASVKKYATKVEARVAKLEKKVKADSAATSKGINALDSRISANAGVANERVDGIYGHVNAYEAFNDSVASRAEERLQSLEQKLAKCKMKKR